MDANGNRLRNLPAINELVDGAAQIDPAVPRWAISRAARETVDAARAAILADRVGGDADDVSPASVARLASTLARPSLRRVINATGVILHTNLGRAPLAMEASDAARLATGYSNLEYDLDEGKRGSRHQHVVGILRDLSGAEDACVVNNNAAAVMLLLAGVAAGREVVVSRGELIEIGGSFRIPDVMHLAGANLKEVGTTNKTHERDYRTAVGGQTALLMKVHQANFEVVGFKAEVSAAGLATIGRDVGVPTAMDLGSGALASEAELAEAGLSGEPGVRETLTAGIDVVTFSCDKLLGGPQAGVIAGKKELVDRARNHPLMRSVRPGKLTLAALYATLDLYRRGSAACIPAVAMVRRPSDDIKRCAETLAARFPRGEGCDIRVIPCDSTVGGGTKPTARLASWALALTPRGRVDDAAARLRQSDPPVIGRVEDGALVLDLRCVSLADIDAVERAVRSACEIA